MLDIKPSHKPIKGYYEALKTFEHHGITHETSVRNAFQDLLKYYAGKKKWDFIEEYQIPLSTGNKGSIDGAITDSYHQVMGYWEAKDSKDDLGKEVDNKFKRGYPQRNTLFQEPTKAILYQDGIHIDDYDLTKPEDLVACLRTFFEYRRDEQANWEQVVEDFKERIPESARRVIEMIETEKVENKKFKAAFAHFSEICRQSINPNLSDAAIEEMLVQHLLTSRIFESVFDRKDFDRRNIIAKEIEHVIDALTSREFSREKFFKPLDHFYVALENRAKSIDDWSQKQHFLNAVYEKFFQGFSVKVADTHGIVYTPQPIVDFMVKSVDHILKTEFGRSLGDEGVHILDPFTGTGNFIMRVMKEIPKTKLPKKYAGELHCNEIMLLPYYIASMNIEHEYFAQTGEYKPFEGICLVDTFELAEGKQIDMFGSSQNTKRVQRQKDTPITVVIGNPPYNAGQLDENDNNKNRKYVGLDSRVEETYARASKAKLKIKLNDPYVKAFRFASDRVIDNGEGIVCFVSNNSFIDGIAFDGMREHLTKEYQSVYVLDLGGNVRKNPKLSGTKHNVFGIQVGVSINIFVKHKDSTDSAKIYYARTDEFSTKEEKYKLLASLSSSKSVDWTEVTPDKENTWMTQGLRGEFEAFISLGGKESEGGKIFEVISNSLRTNRDFWAYNFQKDDVASNMKRMIEVYNSEVDRYSRHEGKKPDVDTFVIEDDKRIKWSGDLKMHLARGKSARFATSSIRRAMYRPFTQRYVYFDRLLNNSIYNWPRIFPTDESERENRAIWMKIESNWPMFPLLTDRIPDFMPEGGSQCFPFYTYDEDGSNRRENITDWAVSEFHSQLKIKKEELRVGTAEEKTAAKWQIFYYVYGVLHHPEYRSKYAANLRRELPRVPVSPDFFEISRIGKQLADLHVGYENVKPYELEQMWREGSKLNLRVEKMKLTKDKRSIVYNADLTLSGIPEDVYEYKLGNRSALEWIIDQYQVSTDKRSGITNDPNREDDPEYILQLLQKVITVSLETVKLVRELSGLRLG